jgi:hypothetical protein
MENTSITLLRSIKGAPLSILVALFLSVDPIGHDYLCRVTGYSKDSVTNGLQILNDLGLASPLPGKRYCGWMLSAKAKQLELFAGSPNFQDSNNTTTSDEHSLTILSSSSTPSESVFSGLEMSEKLEITKELRNAKIYGITAMKLAKDPFITLDYVKAHIAKAKREKTDTALLIYRMKEHDPMPEDETDEWKSDAHGKYGEWINV